MRETLDKMLASLREYFAKMPRKTRIRMGILAAAVVVLAIVVVSLLSRTEWVAISNSEDVAITNDIVATLGGFGIQTRRDGNLVEVPEGRAQEAQQVLFEQGLVGTPVFDYSIMEGAASFSVSSEHANELYDMQTAEHIRTMLMQNPKVQNAFVIINRGESSPFRIQTNTRKATATVQLTLNDDDLEGLSKSEAKGVADTVKGAVQGIEYEDIYITDNLYNTYIVGEDSEDMDLLYNQRIALQNRLTEQAKRQAEQLLLPIYGPTHYKVQPYIRLNFDKTTINKVEFDPPIPGEEGGIIRSAERIFEMQRNWANAEGIPGTDENGMGVAEYPWGTYDNDDIYRRDVEQLNYEINETRTAIEVANGDIEEFGISVLVNSDYYKFYIDDDVEEEVEAPPEYVDEIKETLSRSLGIATGNISVQYLPFNNRDTSEEDYQAMLAAKEEQERRDMWIDRIFMYGTILLLAIMVFLLVRSVANTLRPPPEPEVILTADGPGIDLDLLIAEEEAALAEAAAAEAEQNLPGPDDIDLNAKSPTLEQIGKFIDKDPAAVAQLLRNWLSDDM